MIVHVSLDIETFSSRGDASIASIGAFAFTLDPEVPRFAKPFGLETTFYTTVDDPTGHFDPETIRWHAKQDNPVATTGGDRKAQPVKKALESFTHWLNYTRRWRAPEGEEHNLLIWSHATFDAPIISLAAARNGIPNPWGYRDARDLRTLYQIARGRPSPEEILQAMNFKMEDMIAHKAIDDAIWQAYEIAICFDQIANLRGDQICEAF